MIQITKCYFLLLFLHWVIDYLERQYGACARKTVYYHLDNANQMTNTLKNGKKSSKHLWRKRETILQRGCTESCQSVNVCPAYKPQSVGSARSHKPNAWSLGHVMEASGSNGLIKSSKHTAHTSCCFRYQYLASIRGRSWSVAQYNLK